MRNAGLIGWTAAVVTATATACGGTVVGPEGASSAASSSGSSGSSGGAACADHVYYAGMYPSIASIWANLPDAAGLTSLAAGDAQCKALGADHVCDLTEVQAANAHEEPLFMAIPAGTTAWMQRTTPVYVEGLSGMPCTAAMAGQVDPGADCHPDCLPGGDACETSNQCCTGTCTGGTCTTGSDGPCVCALSQPGSGGRCNDWQYGGHIFFDGEYMVFGSSGGVPTAPGLPAQAGDPGFHYDNDTVVDFSMPFAHIHSSPDFSCDVTMRALLCCHPSCM